MNNKRILITGGAGSIGSELARQLCKENKIFILDTNETALFDLIEELPIDGFIGDVRDRETLRVIRDYSFKPDLVFHCAALKHVTPSAWTPDEYIKTNALGTINVLEIFGKIMNIINISTDKVVNPDSIMGATKRVAEIAVRDYDQISVRFGNVLGSRGSVLPIWQKQIDQNKALTVTDEKMERYFMTIEEACELVIKAAEIGKPGEIFILDMGKPVNVLQLAKDILKKSGKDLEIKMIGARPGEKMSEQLMNKEEERLVIKKDKFYILYAKEEETS